MNRTPFDGAPGTTAGSFASYWNVVAFHVYVVPNKTPGGKIEAAMAPLDGTSAARSAVAASRLSASERARRDTIVGRAARSSGRRAADRKSTRLNSSHLVISYAVFCFEKK